LRQKRILIVRQDRIGDVVVSTPIPRAIKKQWPDSFVAVMVRNYTEPIYSNNPYIDKIILKEDIEWDGLFNFFQKVKFIKNFKFTHALMLLPSESVNYLLFFAGIKNRIGVGYKFYQFITFVKGVSRHKYIPLRHEADYCMDLARRIGIKSNNLNTEIFLSDDENIEVKKLKEKLVNNNKILIGIHTTNGNSAPNLNEDDYLKLIKLLQQTNCFKIVITDNSIPIKLQNIEDVEYPNVESDLRKTILNIAALDCLISSSTGPMHIAAALKVKTISLFCPLTACSPQLWGPSGNVNKIILPQENYCSIKCPGDPKICTFNGESDMMIGNIIKSLKDLFIDNECLKSLSG
jgi:heptosyltransferase-2